MNAYFLLVYFIALLLLFIRYEKKKRCFDAGSLLIVVFLVCSFATVISYRPNYEEISFFIPLIYLFIALYLSFKPILRIQPTTEIVFPKRSLVDVFSWIFVACSFLGMATSSTNVVEGLIQVVTNESYGLETYHNMLSNVEGAGHTISNLPMVIMNAMYAFASLLFFVHLTYEKPNKVLVLLLGFTLFYGAIKYVSIGERGGLINRALVVLVSYCSIKEYIPEKLNKSIRIIGVVVGVLITVPFMALTNSRFADTEEGSTNSIYNYAGQGTIFFCRCALDDNGIRYGDRTVSLFKRMLGFPNVPHNFLERRDKYPQLKINDEVFSTFVGDLAIDFGPIVAFLLILLVSFLLSNMVKQYSKRIFFHHFLLLHLSMCIIVQGASLFQYSDAGNLTILFYLLMYIFLKYSNVYVSPN